MDVLKITPDMAAAIIGKHSQFIRIGLQRGLLTYHGEPIGTKNTLVLTEGIPGNPEKRVVNEPGLYTGGNAPRRASLPLSVCA